MTPAATGAGSDHGQERPGRLPAGARVVVKVGSSSLTRADGGLDFLGRADHQIKLRGYRIEMGEIETQIDAVPGVRQSVVIPREDTPGNVQLVGYYLETAPVDPALVFDMPRDKVWERAVERRTRDL